jgi:hypothetical protein
MVMHAEFSVPPAHACHVALTRGYTTAATVHVHAERPTPMEQKSTMDDNPAPKTRSQLIGEAIAANAGMYAPASAQGRGDPAQGPMGGGRAVAAQRREQRSGER